MCVCFVFMQLAISNMNDYEIDDSLEIHILAIKNGNNLVSCYTKIYFNGLFDFHKAAELWTV